MSSKPCRPGHGSRPSRSAARRLSRISSRSVFWRCPAALSSPTVWIVGAGVTISRYSRGQPGAARAGVGRIRCPDEPAPATGVPLRQRRVVRRLLRAAAPRRGAGRHRGGADAVALRGVRRRRPGPRLPDLAPADPSRRDHREPGTDLDRAHDRVDRRAAAPTTRRARWSSGRPTGPPAVPGCSTSGAGSSGAPGGGCTSTATWADRRPPAVRSTAAGAARRAPAVVVERVRDEGDDAAGVLEDAERDRAVDHGRERPPAVGADDDQVHRPGGLDEAVVRPPVDELQPDVDVGELLGELGQGLGDEQPHLLDVGGRHRTAPCRCGPPGRRCARPSSSA